MNKNNYYKMNKDIIMEMMIHMDIVDLYYFCQTSIDNKHLCTDKNFWFLKNSYDHTTKTLVEAIKYVRYVLKNFQTFLYLEFSENDFSFMKYLNDRYLHLNNVLYPLDYYTLRFDANLNLHYFIINGATHNTRVEQTIKITSQTLFELLLSKWIL
jgi:hypothetical protein